MSAQWPRALLRAALREVGYDASGTRSLQMATYQAAVDEGRGPVRLVVLDQDALTAVARRHLEELRRISGAPVVLLATRVRGVPEGPWARVLQRPVTVGDLVRAVETLVPISPEVRGPIDG